jgi:hypothetical protein
MEIQMDENATLLVWRHNVVSFLRASSLLLRDSFAQLFSSNYKQKVASNMANILELGFIKANSTNLLKIDSFMVCEFIKKNDKFNAAEVRNAKAAM